MDSVLIVCRANVCRSPLAEVLWRERAPHVQVASAGLEARPGMLADGVYVEWLSPRSLGLEAHRSSRFHAALAARYDLILVMEEHQRMRICAALPSLHGRVQLLGRWTGGTVADPHGRGVADYRRCLRAIEDGVEAWQERWPMRSPRARSAMVEAACRAV